MQIAPEFVDALAGLDLHGLDREQGTVYATNASFELMFTNRAWSQFAAGNSGADIDRRWGLGSNVLEATGAKLRPFYTALFERALRTRTPQEHIYECSSDALFRKMHMRILPLDRGRPGLLVAST